MDGKKVDVGLIRTDAPEGTRFLCVGISMMVVEFRSKGALKVLRIRPLCHHAWSGW